MAVTLREIAKQSGVSMQTVSGVLNDKAHLFRPETCARVIRAAESLGYRPNGWAKAMRGGRFKAVALVESTNAHLSYQLPGLIAGVQAALSARDLHLVLSSMPDETLTDTGYVPRILRELMADGLLINYTNRIPAKMIELVESYRVPSIWLNVKRPTDCVHLLDYDGAQSATMRLLDAGHRDIAYVDYHNVTTEADPHHSVADRQRGYISAMRGAGLTPRLILLKDSVAPDARIELAAQWLTAPDCPTAVVAYSPLTATPILMAAMMKAGKQVPRDLSIITFAEPHFKEMGIPLSLMLLPEFELGHTAAEMLIEKLADVAQPLRPRTLPLKFDRGGTIAPPNRSNPS